MEAEPALVKNKGILMQLAKSLTIWTFLLPGRDLQEKQESLQNLFKKKNKIKWNMLSTFRISLPTSNPINNNNNNK